MLPHFGVSLEVRNALVAEHEDAAARACNNVTTCLIKQVENARGRAWSREAPDSTFGCDHGPLTTSLSLRLTTYVCTCLFCLLSS